MQSFGLSPMLLNLRGREVEERVNQGFMGSLKPLQNVPLRGTGRFAYCGDRELKRFLSVGWPNGWLRSKQQPNIPSERGVVDLKRSKLKRGERTFRFHSSPQPINLWKVGERLPLRAAEKLVHVSQFTFPDLRPGHSALCQKPKERFPIFSKPWMDRLVTGVAVIRIHFSPVVNQAVVLNLEKLRPILIEEPASHRHAPKILTLNRS